MHVCNLCDTTFTRASNLNRHKKNRCRGKELAGSFAKKSVGVKRPMEFVNFTSDEFGPGGVPKTPETLNKLVKLVNEPTSYHDPPKNIEEFSPGELAEFVKPLAKPVQHTADGPSKKEQTEIIKPMPKSSLQAKSAQQVNDRLSKKELAK